MVWYNTFLALFQFLAHAPVVPAVESVDKNSDSSSSGLVFFVASSRKTRQVVATASSIRKRTEKFVFGCFRCPVVR